MYTDDVFPSFTKHLGKFFSTQWSKIKSTASSSQSEKNIDQQLEEEYETLLREIDYLTAEKSCYLSFLNENFHKPRSSDDLSTILKKHSSEVLRNYLKNNEKGDKTENFINRQDLINYVTEIVVSNKCNNKLCSCKPIRLSKEILTDKSVPQENGKETQTNSVGDAASEKAINVKPINTEQANQTKPNYERNTVTTVQTDDKPVQYAATSDSRVTASKIVSANVMLPNCFGENASNRFCVPSNFEGFLENGTTNQQFSACTKTRDCSCDAYDVKKALQRGLVLPSSDICIQKKKITIFNRNKKEKGTKKEKMKTSSEVNEKTDETSSDNKKLKGKDKVAKKKEKKEKKEKTTPSSNSSSPQEKPKKGGGLASCFGPRKKSGCDEYCQGKIPADRSMQTLAIRTWDKNEEVGLSEMSGKKTAQTSTGSETATQVSAKSSKQDMETSVIEKKSTGKFWSKGPKKDKETWSRDDQLQEPKPSKIYKESLTSKDAQFRFDEDVDDNKKNKDNRERGDKEKVKNEICNKCGRQKRDCVSGCRNTIIIPYASSSSSKALPAGDVDSLRMLIKMQSRETNRQIDNIMSELHHQKSEVRRLNDMYQKMMGNYYEMQSSRSKQPSDLSRECRCSSNAKACGCSISNECKILKKNVTPKDSNNDNGRNAENIQLRRFGPPNTPVAINRCDVCKVQMTENSVRASFTKREDEYNDGDKQRKNQLNQSKQAEKSRQNVPTKQDNILGEEIENNKNPPKENSVSTLYKNDKSPDEQIDKISIHKNLSDDNNIKESEVPDIVKNNVIGIETDTDNGEPGKKTRGNSSRILIWLKKSWINIKHKTEDCRKEEKTKWEDQAWKCMFKYCEDKVKQAATGLWKTAKNVTKSSGH